MNSCVGPYFAPLNSMGLVLLASEDLCPCAHKDHACTYCGMEGKRQWIWAVQSKYLGKHQMRNGSGYLDVE